MAGTNLFGGEAHRLQSCHLAQEKCRQVQNGGTHEASSCFFFRGVVQSIRDEWEQQGRYGRGFVGLPL